jgi:predicted alpha/beta superfamily hydrolase
MGHVQILHDYPSPSENIRRTVRIYTPDAYDAEPERRFPVLYMQDGQNVFAHPESAIYHTWCVNTALERLVAEGRLEPWIIVAVDHTGPGRWPDYTPWDDPKRNVRARGHLYARFLRDQLKPWVDQTYRTRPEPEWTGAMGSSLGGLISLYLGLAMPETFGRIGAVSPTVMWSDGQIFKEWKAHPRKWTRIYLDAGSSEYIEVDGLALDYGAYTRDFFIHLKQLGYADHEVCLVLEPGGTHDEPTWQRRLPFALRWLLA